MRKALFAGICSLVGCTSDWQIVDQQRYDDTGVEDTVVDTGSYSGLNCNEGSFEYPVEGGSRPGCFAVETYSKSGQFCANIFYLSCFSELGGMLVGTNFNGSAETYQGDNECGNGFQEFCVAPQTEGTYNVDLWLFPSFESDLSDEEHRQQEPIGLFLVVDENGTRGVVNK